MAIHRRRATTTSTAVALVAVLALAACSSSDGGGSDAAGAATTTAPPASFDVRVAEEVTPPPAEGDGMVVPQPAVPLPEGYVQEELLVGGTATRFDAVDTPDDGHWVATPGDEAEYRTRVIVRRPASPEDFSGTVVVEWFNVSAIEASPDWAYLAQEIGEEGHAYVGVSAQRQGVEGGDTILDVEVDEQAAAETGVTADTSGLRNIDPERYGTLVHPGDGYAFDIFSQVGATAGEPGGGLLGDLEPTQVIAVGESQSAIFLSTLVNAVHPLDPVYDGILIHSRGANVAPLDGEFLSAAERGEADDPAAALEDAVLIRTDLHEPVMLVESETDLTLLGYAHARQPDTERVATWEVAGTAHADAHFIRAITGGPRDPGLGSLLGCTEPINTGPHHEVVSAALHQLVAWADGGPPPPPGEPIELTDDEEPTIARDEDGNALGGVRNPLVDVPVATLTGDPPGGATIEDLADGGGDVCILFGGTEPFDRATLVERYGTADDYLEAFRASAEAAVEAGYLLPHDADELIAEAEANRPLFG